MFAVMFVTVMSVKRALDTFCLVNSAIFVHFEHSCVGLLIRSWDVRQFRGVTTGVCGGGGGLTPQLQFLNTGEIRAYCIYNRPSYIY